MTVDTTQILPGTLEMLILRAVSLGEQHGYGVLLRIEQLSGGVIALEQGAVYPALARLVRQGFLKTRWGASENNRRAKFYAITKRGGRRLGKQQASWDRLVEAMSLVLGKAEA